MSDFSTEPQSAGAETAQRDFERFFNLIPDLACIVSIDGYFKKVNPAWETTLGYTHEEIGRASCRERVSKQV